MSIDYLRVAQNLMRENSHLFYATGGVSHRQIEEAERDIMARCRGGYRAFLEEFGTLQFGGTEIYGLKSSVDAAKTVHVTDFRQIYLRDVASGEWCKGVFRVSDIGDGTSYALFSQSGVLSEEVYYADVRGNTIGRAYDSFGDMLLYLIALEIELDDEDE